MDSQTTVSITAIIVSGVVGLAGVVLSFRGFFRADSVRRAARRTLALQMLSDEEFALSQVRTECKSIELLTISRHESLGEKFDHLRSETARIVNESDELLASVRERRTAVGRKIQVMRVEEIEAVIAEAYHGKILANAQLHATTRSREDTIRIYLS